MSSLTTTRLINEGWRLREAASKTASPNTVLPWIPASVPGHVHVDLVRAGVMADPFERMAERGAQWVDETDWVYETTFTMTEPAPENVLLIFDGLDTIAEIELNDVEIGKTDNMFVPHEFEVGHLLRDANTLRVTLRSARTVGAERLRDWAASGADTLEPDHDRWSPRSFVRKAQYMYGWDWGPQLASSGIWRPVKLVHRPVARMLDYRYDAVFRDCHDATVTFEVFVDRAKSIADTPLSLTLSFLRVGNESGEVDAPLPDPITVDVPSGKGRIGVTISLDMDEPQRWWPNRHNPAGAGVHPTLYTVEMTLTAGGSTVDSRTVKVGLRTIELIRDPDADGYGEASARGSSSDREASARGSSSDREASARGSSSNRGESFKFRVNECDIFARGANWIPADSYPSRLENEAGKLDSGDMVDERVHNLVWMACDAGYNMLRVWGGGIYESEHFYELCDEHGILVWQDFAYGCAYYPDTGAYAEAARTEAIAAVRRIRSHPSLALWCGNNENDWMYAGNWGGMKMPRHIGEKLYHEILPAVVAEEDPGTPYWPSSPWGGDDPNSSDIGDKHNWNVWHGVGDWVNYAQDSSRFVSEFGFAASCGLSAWEGCLADADRSSDSDVVRWHDKTRKGYDTYLGMVALHYPLPGSLEDLVYYTQLNQADALKFGVEHYRRLKGRCWGTLFWQINDCWPVQSWAVIDSDLQPKAAYYASCRFYAPVIVSLKRYGSTVDVHIVNDALGPVDGSVTVALKSFDGETLAEAAIDAPISANVSAKVGSLDMSAAAGRETSTYVVAVLTGPEGHEVHRNLMLLAEPKDLALTDPELDVELEEQDEDALAVIITAKSYAAGVWLYVDPAEVNEPVEFSDNFFHLEAGETRTVVVEKSPGVESAEDLQAVLQLRTLFDR